VRLGVYHSKIRKPHGTSFFVGSSDLVVDMELSSWGGVLQAEGRSYKVEIDLGASKLKANQDLAPGNPFKGTGVDLALIGEFHPTLYHVGKSSRWTFSLSPFARFEFRMQVVPVSDEDVGSLSSDGSGAELSMDILVDGGLRMVLAW
jgi:hypothetical protein